jgi:apolipoprotein D and lipocalin family protein
MKNAFLACTLFLLLTSCASNGPIIAPPEVVPQVDLVRYTGRWYEIASFPQRFQKGCTDSRAEYRILDNGTVEVLNSCFRNGKVDTAKGKAWVVDTATNAKLKVSFFWPFRGDYWIIDLGKDYDYAVVSAPSRKYLWILSREKLMSAALYDRIVANLKDRGFDIVRLQKTIQGDRP